MSRALKGGNREGVYGWVNRTLQQQHYRDLGRTGHGVVRLYVAKMTGLSRAQVTRLISQYLQGEAVKPKVCRRRRFPRLYTAADAELLAAADAAHEDLSGPAVLWHGNGIRATLKTSPCISRMDS
jgi:hypothetical protein